MEDYYEKLKLDTGKTHKKYDAGYSVKMLRLHNHVVRLQPQFLLYFINI